MGKRITFDDTDSSDETKKENDKFDLKKRLALEKRITFDDTDSSAMGEKENENSPSMGVWDSGFTSCKTRARMTINHWVRSQAIIG